MANRFPLIVKVGQVNTIEELASGDNLDLTGNGLIVDTDKVLSLPQVSTTLVGTDTSQTLSNKVLSLPKIGDTTGDHFYQFAVNELVATRNITLPLLTNNDEFVFKDHTQTLTNKTLTSPTLTNPTINAGGGTLVLPQGTTPAQTEEGSIFWDTNDDLLTIGTATGRKTLVDTDSTQSLSGKTISNLIITGTLTAGGTSGINNYVLKSTGTGVQWVQSSDAIAITDATNAVGTVYPLLVSETSGTLVDVDILTNKLSIDGPTGDITVGTTTLADSSNGAIKVTGGIKATNIYVPSSTLGAISEVGSISYTTGNSSATGTAPFAVTFAITATNSKGETIGTSSGTRFYPWTSGATAHTATVTWGAVAGAVSYKVYRKTSLSNSWFLAETVPEANTRTHSTTFSISRASSFGSAPGFYTIASFFFYYLSTPLSPVNGASSGSATLPRSSNTTGVSLYAVEVGGSISATSIRLTNSTPLVNTNGAGLEFIPKYSPTIYTGDGTTTTYSIATSGLNDYDLFVTVGGVPQTPGNSYAYYISGSNIVFTEAPNPTDRIVIRYNLYKVRGSS